MQANEQTWKPDIGM